MFAKLNQDVVKAVLETIPSGQMFTVIFEKKDGSLRKMVCQKGVRKHVKGTGTSPSKHNPDLQVVFEQGVESYRSFNTKAVVAIRARGTLLTNAEANSIREVMEKLEN